MLVDQRPRERHALLLAAGQLVRIMLGEMREADPVERTLDAGLDLGGADMPQLEAVCDVLKYRAVRPQRVGLKHEAEPARLGGLIELRSGVEQNVVADADGAAVRRLQAGDRAQQRGLAASGGAQESSHLSRRDGD